MSEQTTGYTAEDMADQAASQFRAGYDSAKRGDPEPIGNGGCSMNFGQATKAKVESYMNTYIGTKIVRAVPMTRLQYNEFRGWTVPADENPADEGYLVEYTDGGKPNTAAYDGYVSWSPKEQFDKAYVLVGEVQGNCLAPHEVRVLAEQAELSDRIGKLKAFIGGERFNALPTEDRTLLSTQLEWMDGYSRVLAARIGRFLVTADDFDLPAQACDLSGEGTCEACQ